MTDPAGGAPTPPPPSGNWQAPQPPPAGAPGGFNPNFQQAPVEVGPAPGIVYADLVTRLVAYVIDAIILGVVWTVIWGVIIGSLLLTAGFGMVFIVGIVLGALWLVGSAVYFVYTWTTMRASPGQKILKLETVNAADGATLTQPQAIRRWAFLFGPSAAGYALNAVFGSSLTLAFLGMLLGLAAAVYAIYLLYSASQSSKRQGFHDVQAGTVVIKHL